MRAAGFAGPILFSPVLRIVPVAPGDLPEGTLVFTSRHAVLRATALGLADRPAVAVGDATARSARLRGFACDVGPGDAAGLVDFLLRRTTGPLLHLRGRHVTFDLTLAPRQAGRAAADRVVYDQLDQPLTEAARRMLTEQSCLLPLYSPRSARLVAGQLDPARARPTVIAISKAVAEAWPLPGPLHIAQVPNAAGMIARIGALVAPDGER
ncbi:uroporphyrinogen-III synthase [Maribius pontilimi]|uniref:Uroporphyrinogen-III synthase n=1 Tax=Palleronia pontilimi TaxID=1964209 RepID=A0A934IF81_9RHOB|nr:uroporphyrinogen-III synthase [Palleronia pontilimi]